MDNDQLDNTRLKSVSMRFSYMLSHIRIWNIIAIRELKILKIIYFLFVLY